MDEHELTCGQEIAASAEVPNALAALMRHVVINLRAHAHWVGQETPTARLEHEGLLAVARGYEDVAAAAESLATLMQSMRALEATPHESSRLDRASLLGWMRTKVQLQRKLAQLLETHAQTAERTSDAQVQD
jgi:hypothetical protein